MRFRFKCFVSAILISLSAIAYCDDSSGGNGGNGGSGSGGNGGDSGSQDALKKIEKYLKNLGEYFGYDLTKYCDAGGKCSESDKSKDNYSNFLIDENDAMAPQLNLYSAFLGALLGHPGSNSATSTSLVPQDLSEASLLNSLGSQTFSNPSYKDPSQSHVSVIDKIDQKEYRSNPVDQTSLNILSTPNHTYCETNDGKKRIKDCKYLDRTTVLSQTIGTIPSTDEFFKFDYVETYLPQLSADTLLTPMLYSTDKQLTTGGKKEDKGLNAETQAQMAANFIRYVSGTVIPLNLSKRSDYDELYGQANNLDGKTSDKDQAQAKVQLATYLLGVRTYTSQLSVGMSNLYYILSRRLAVSSGNESTSKDKKPMSLALEEYNMASWRLFNPKGSTKDDDKDQWLSHINKASSATVQKEIAVLLAEINYQMYLNRQLQERQLLTETILLMQNATASQPQSTIENTPLSN